MESQKMDRMNTDGETIATLSISQSSAGNAPLGEAVTVVADAAGFREASGLGRGGESAGTLPLAAVVQRLTRDLDKAELRQVLAHFAELYQALA
jgi:hypothetical protein